MKTRAATSPGARPELIAATDDVTTTRFSPASAANFSARSVPATAGATSDPGLTLPIGNGDAQCSMKVAPRTAAAQPASSSRSHSTSSTSLRTGWAARWATAAALLLSRTVPRTA